MTNISMILQRAGRADPHRPAVYHGARLISSASTMLANSGPCSKTNVSVERW